jgi:hypothetical protein
VTISDQTPSEGADAPGAGHRSGAGHTPGQVAGTPAMPESPSETGDPRPDRQGAAHAAAASDVPAQTASPGESKDPPPGQEEQPEQGTTTGAGPAPEEIGESG